MRLLPILALCLVAVSGCKAVDAMDNTSDMKHDLAGMKQTTGGMATTTTALANDIADLKHKDVLGHVLDDLVAEDNTHSYAPPAHNLVIAAKLVAETMTSDEMIQFFDIALKEIREMKPKASAFDPTTLGNYSPAYVEEFNTAQQVRIISLEAVAGQIPQPMVEQIVREQLIDNGGGSYPDEALELLMLRAMFIDGFYLDQEKMASGKVWSDAQQVVDAEDLITKLDYLAALPFADRIAFKTGDTTFLPVVNGPVLHEVPDAYFKVPEQKFDDLPADATDEQKAALAAQKQAYQDQLDAQVAKDNAEDEYLEKCAWHASKKEKARGCFPTLGDAPSYNITMQANIDVTHWWKKLGRQIAALPQSVKDDSRVSEAREVVRRRLGQ